MILVAGGRGFIGSAVIRELVTRRKAVAVMSHNPTRARGKFEGLDVEIRYGDVRRPETLDDAIRGCDTVISSLQFPWYPVENPRFGWTFEEIDHRGTKRLVEASRRAGVQRFIYMSAAGVGPEAQAPWYRAKWGAETAVRESGVPYTFFKPTWVYGPEDRSLNLLALFSALLPFAPVMGEGTEKLQPVYITQLAKCICDSLEMESTVNRSFTVAGPNVITMNDAVRTIMDVQRIRKPLLHIPASLFKVVGAILKLPPVHVFTPEAVDFITADAVGDPTELVRAFDLRLIGFHEGLSHYLSPASRVPTFAH